MGSSLAVKTIFDVDLIRPLEPYELLVKFAFHAAALWRVKPEAGQQVQDDARKSPYDSRDSQSCLRESADCQNPSRYSRDQQGLNK
jgi:hypothetical protein